jgi:sugar lactone lactonase YvrE
MKLFVTFLVAFKILSVFSASAVQNRPWANVQKWENSKGELFFIQNEEQRIYIRHGSNNSESLPLQIYHDQSLEQAKIEFPSDITGDGFGNLYVASCRKNQIYKLVPTDSIKTNYKIILIAGHEEGYPGISPDGMMARGSPLSCPSDIRTDSKTNRLYFTEQNRKPPSSSLSRFIYPIFKSENFHRLFTSSAIPGRESPEDTGEAATVHTGGDGDMDMVADGFSGKPPTGRRLQVQVPTVSPTAASSASKLIWTGVSPQAQLGISVAIGGDVNGDGRNDMLIAAMTSGGTAVNQVYVVYGSSVLPSVGNLPVTRIKGALSGNVAVALGPGMHGNILIASGSQAYLIFGRANLPDITLASLPPEIGITLTAPLGTNGMSVSIGGDTNGDGKGNDILIGISGFNSHQGRVYLIYGGKLTTSVALASLPTTSGVTITGVSGSQTGYSVSLSGDVNGDSKADILIGAPGYTANKGAVYLIYGGLTANITVGNTVPAGTGIMFEGDANSYTGRSVAFAGDIDHDGFSDLLICTEGSGSYQGRVYLIYGGKLPPALTKAVLSGTELAGARSIIFAASPYNGLLSATGGGDVNNDGYQDFVIGANAYSSNRGRVYVIYGKSNTTVTSLALDTLIATQGISLTGAGVGDSAGTAVAVGDITGDGFAEVLIGAPYCANPLGRAYLLSGASLTSNVSLGAVGGTPQPDLLVPSASPTVLPTSSPTVLLMRVVAGIDLPGTSANIIVATSAAITARVPWVDSTGVIYIPDDSSHTIRKADTAGIISKFGGTGTLVTTGISGPIGSVSFNFPYSIVGDSGGTLLYISDQRHVWIYLFSTDIATVFAHAAGSVQGFSGDSGPASLASLFAPTGLWLTTTNVLYIADRRNHRIRKVSTEIISTVAGSGCAGAGCPPSFSGDNGPATSATLYNPQGVYMDSIGRLFIADTDNKRIRVVDTNSIISTFAGSGSSPYNGNYLAATMTNLNDIRDIKGDTIGNIFIPEFGNCMVRVVNAQNIISTLFGTNVTCGFSAGVSAGTSPINGPVGIWVDSLSNLYFSDYNSIRVSSRSSSMVPTVGPTTVSTIFPSRTPSAPPNSPAVTPPTFVPSASSPSLSPLLPPTWFPTQMPAPILTGMQPTGQPTAQPTRQPISQPTGQPTRQPISQPTEQPTGQPTGVPSGQPTSRPTKLATDVPTFFPTFFPTFVPSTAVPSTAVPSTASGATTVLAMQLVAGTSSAGSSGDAGPGPSASISVSIPWLDSSGNIYLPDDVGFRIRKITSTTGIISTLPSSTASGSLGPYSIVGDTLASELYISDQAYIWKYAIATNIVSMYVSSAYLNAPKGLWLTTENVLYIADSQNHRIKKVSSAMGTVTTVAGSACDDNTACGRFSGDNGPATSSGLNNPSGVYVDTNGKVFIADTMNHRIRVVDSNGIITTFAGSGTQGFSGENVPAESANLKSPRDVKGDSLGNIYIADYGNFIIRMVDSSGKISTLFGIAGSQGFSPGLSARSSNLNGPTGLWVDSLSTVYFADYNSIRAGKMVAATPTIAPSIAPSISLTASPTPISTLTPTVIPSGYCPAGTFCSGGSVDSCSACTPCPKGFFTAGNPFTQATSCIQCTNDCTTAGLGGNSCFFATCAAGYFSTVCTGNSCTACPAGFKSTAGSNACYLPAVTDSYPTMELVAGTSTSGYSGDNGAAASAQLDTRIPWRDSVGNMYIPDSMNSRIRKVDSGGIITTFAGTGTSSIAGTSSVVGSATFRFPWCIVGGSNGFYLSDVYYVWRYEFSTNIVSVFAQSTTLPPGFSGDGGAPSSAQLNDPRGLWLTTAGVLYIADSSNHRIRKVVFGNITTEVGSSSSGSYHGDGGLATDAQLNNPSGVYMALNGTLYIADRDNHRIRVVNRNNIISTFAGTGTADSSGNNIFRTAANLNGPRDVKGDSLGNIFIADTFNCLIRVVDLKGIISTFFGSSTCGYSSGVAARSSSIIQYPQGIFLDSASNVYFSDSNSIHVAKLATGPGSTTPTVLAMQLIAGNATAGYHGDGGSATSTSAQIGVNIPWVDSSSNVYLPDDKGFRIRKIVAGIISTFGGTGTSSTAGAGGTMITSATFFKPYSIVGDSAALYISDQFRVWKYVFSSQIVSVFVGSSTTGFYGDGGPATSAQLKTPKGLWLTTDNILYIADSLNHRIRKVEATGIITTVAGGPGCGTSFAGGFGGDDGPGTSSNLYTPTGVYTDTNGRMFIADSGNNRIRVVRNIAGIEIITTFAGSGIATPFNGENIPAILANLDSPRDVKGDSLGNIYIADYNHRMIRMVDSNGIIWTLFGGSGSGFTPDISLSSSKINSPRGIWVNSLGSVYFSDYNSIHVGVMVTAPSQAPTFAPSFSPTAIIPSASPTILPTAPSIFSTSNPTAAPSIAGGGGGVTTVVEMKLIAGTSTTGYSGDSGPATSAQINVRIPWVDSSGSVYLTDDNSWRIRKISSPACTISTFINPTPAMNLYHPYSIVGDSLATVLYISDQLKVWKYEIGTNIASEYVSGLSNTKGLWLTTGNVLYIADFQNHQIKQVSPSGIVTIAAGSACSSSPCNGFSGDGGPATDSATKLYNPTGVFVNTNGKMFIADSGNHRIRVVSSTGIITTFAGAGTQGFSGVNIQAISANLNTPMDVKGDSLGNIYIADSSNFIIRMVDSNGIISTLFGTHGVQGFSPGLSPRSSNLNGPIGLWVDSMSTVYFTDSNSIHSGKVTTLTPSTSPTTNPTVIPTRTPTSAPTAPTVLAMQLLAGQGSAGNTGDNGPASLATIGAIIPWVDSTGNIYLPDDNGYRIRKITSTTGIITTFGGSGFPSDAGTSPIPIATASFYHPYSIVGDAAGTVMYISDQLYIWKYDFSTHIVSVYAHVGTTGSYAGDGGPAALAKLNGPKGLWLTTDNNLYIADSANYRIRKISSAGIISTVAGSGCSDSASCFSGDDGPATSAVLNNPAGVYVDTTGRIFIADTDNHRILVVSTSGIITTFAGTGAQGYNVVSISAISAKFNAPHDVKGDSKGNIYIADFGNSIIRMVDTSGIISTLFGTPGAQGFSPGVSLRTSRIQFPRGIWVNSLGSVYFSDYNSIHAGVLVTAPSQTSTDPPSSHPSAQPSSQPIKRPTCLPTGKPSSHPSVQPTKQPTSLPTRMPSSQPTKQPTSRPSSHPTDRPSNMPSGQPSLHPTGHPSTQPTNQPVSRPSRQPSALPSSRPSRQPSSKPTTQPSDRPSSRPSNQPTSFPSGFPSCQPSGSPTNMPSSHPSDQPTTLPSRQPTSLPSVQPSSEPTKQPFAFPTTLPTGRPSEQPTSRPSSQPSSVPSSQPSCRPSDQPTKRPTNIPTAVPTRQPSSEPSSQPSKTPTSQPTTFPSSQPSTHPSVLPTSHPSSIPSRQPSGLPTTQPSSRPSGQPSVKPSAQPTRVPSSQPSGIPTKQPTSHPSSVPTAQPTEQPTSLPSRQPSGQPSSHPSSLPSAQPSSSPSTQPTSMPSSHPSSCPTVLPTNQPTTIPSSVPSVQPSTQPSTGPSAQPSALPTSHPSVVPTVQPTGCPSSQPSLNPTSFPTGQPSLLPSTQPSVRPSQQPSSVPTTVPSSQPQSRPTGIPTTQPSGFPSSIPTGQPSSEPTGTPTAQPSCQPSGSPTGLPSTQPSRRPSSVPTSQPSEKPSSVPSSIPSSQPSISPTNQPTSRPSKQPNSSPSVVPSTQPSSFPSHQPTSDPTSQPSTSPTSRPSGSPTVSPTVKPSLRPSSSPSVQPTSQPSRDPTRRPSSSPSRRPTGVPSAQPFADPSSHPTVSPSHQPITRPSKQPLSRPTSIPSVQPSSQPSKQPLSLPSTQPTVSPTKQPVASPTSSPTWSPRSFPTVRPKSLPTSQPSLSPSASPSRQPSGSPTGKPTELPSRQPLPSPSSQPTRQPSSLPSAQPTRQPISRPSRQPIAFPTRQPISQPSSKPTTHPSHHLTIPVVPRASAPTVIPTFAPSFSLGSLWNTKLTNSVPSISEGDTSSVVSRESFVQRFLWPDLSINVNDGCSSYKNFIGNQLYPATLNELQPANIKFLYIDSLQDEAKNSVAECSNTTATTMIVAALISSNQKTTSIAQTISCNGNIWKLKKCSSASDLLPAAVCVNCVDPCLSADSSVSCPSAASSHVGIAFSALSVSFVEPPFAPKIVSADVSVNKTSATVNVKLSSEGVLYYGIFGQAASTPASISTVIIQNHIYLTKNNRTTIMIPGLQAATDYVLYFVTKSVQGSQMSFADMLGTKTDFTTLCCRLLSLQMSSPNLLAGESYYNAISVKTDAPPSSELIIRTKLYRISNNGVPALYSKTGLFFPSQSIFQGSNLAASITLSNLTAGQYTMGLTVEGSEADLYSIKPVGNVFNKTSLLFTVQPKSKPLPSPLISSVLFSDDGTYLVINFNGNTNLGGLETIFACEKIFNFTCASQSKCQWIDSKTIYAYLEGGDSCTQPGDKFQYLAKTANPFTAACSQIASNGGCFNYTHWLVTPPSSTKILPPINPPIPNVVLSMPAIIGQCASLQIDLTSSSGNGGRSWKTVLIVVQSSSANTTSVQNYLNSHNYDVSLPVTIPYVYFLPGFSYNFIVTLCNFLGQCNPGIKKSVVVSNIIPTVRIAGSNLRNIKIQQSLNLAAFTTLSRCGDDVNLATFYNFDFLWSISKGTSLLNSLVSTSKDASKFVLPAYSLQIDTFYQIQVKVGYRDVSSLVSAQINVISGDLVPVIQGGSNQLLRAGSMITLNGSRSYDENVNNLFGKSAGLLYEWKCLQIATVFNESCFNVFDRSSLFPQTGKVVKLTARSTSANFVAQITMLIQDSSKTRSASSTVTVSVVPPLTASLTLQSSSSNSLNTINIGQSLLLTGSVQLPDISYANLSWSSSSSSSSGLDLTSVALTPLRIAYLKPSTGINSVFLKLSTQLLQGGVSYSFSLTCSLPVPGISTTTSIVINVNSPPRPGKFVISPNEGTEFREFFTFACSQWQDDNLPLQYQFGFVTPTGSQITLNSLSEISYKALQMPAGLKTNGYSLSCSAQIFDSLLANATTYSSVVVKEQSTQSSKQLQNYFNQSVNIFASSDVSAIKQATGMASYLLNKVNCSLAPDCSLLNRQACYSTAQTCGSCLSVDYIGTKGDSNEKCYKTLSDVPTTVSAVLKSCEGNGCSGHGTCKYKSLTTNQFISTCFENDLSCSPICSCDPGYTTNAICDISDEQAAVKMMYRENLLNGIQTLMGVEDVSDQSLSNWMNNVNEATKSSGELSENGILLALRISNNITSLAKDRSLDSSNFVGLLNTLDSVSSAQMIIQSKQNSSSSNSTIVTIQRSLDQFTALLSSSLVKGEEASTLVTSNIRVYASSVPVSGGITDNSNNNTCSTYATIAMPQTNLEKLLRIKPNVILIPTCGSSSSSGYLQIGISSLSSGVYDSSFNSDPVSLSLSSFPCQNAVGCEVKMILQRQRPSSHSFNLSLIEQQKKMTFNTSCSLGDHSTHFYSCLDGKRLNATCRGEETIIITKCPVVTVEPSCNILSGLNVLKNSCKRVAYTDRNITCLCSLLSSFSSTRRLTNSSLFTIPEGEIHVSYVSMLGAVTDNFESTVISASHLNSDVVARGWQAIVIVGTLFVGFAVGMIFSYFADKQNERVNSLEEKLKAKAVKSTQNESQNRFNLSALNSKNRRENIKTVTKKDQMNIIQLAEESLPQILGSKSLFKKVANEMKRHHRWLGVIFHYSVKLSRVLRVASLACNIIIMLFIQSLTYNLTHGDDGTCEALKSEQTCLEPASAFATGQSQCYWTPSSPGSSTSSTDGHCSYVQPDSSIEVVLFVAIFSSLISTPFALLADKIIVDVLSAPTLDKNDNHKINDVTEEIVPTAVPIVPDRLSILNLPPMLSEKSENIVLRKLAKMTKELREYREFIQDPKERREFERKSAFISLFQVAIFSFFPFFLSIVFRPLGIGQGGKLPEIN